jgi:electron transport complex protein RnfG
MKGLFRLGFILMAICSVCALGLALINRVTSPFIASQKIEEEMNALKEVLPQASEFKEVAMGDRTFQMGYYKGKLVGGAFKFSASGYSGPIEIVMGVSDDGRESGIKILTHSETPGLGARITEPWFTWQFKGKMLDEIFLEKGRIDAIAGATISSRGVTDAVRENLKSYLEIFPKLKEEVK